MARVRAHLLALPALLSLAAARPLADALGARLRRGSKAAGPLPRAPPGQDALKMFQRSIGMPVNAGPSKAPPMYRQRLTNYMDVQYIADIRVGGQTMKAVFDTGSWGLLVFARRCDSCGDPEHTYESSRSSTYHPGNAEMEQTYDDGSTFSVEAFDRFELGPYTAENQSFWEVYKASMPVLNGSAFKAIVGVGPPSTAREIAIKDAWNLEREPARYWMHGRAPPEPLRKSAYKAIVDAGRAAAKLSLAESLGVKAFSVCLGREARSPGVMTWSDTLHLRHPKAFHHIPMAGGLLWKVRIEGARLHPLPGSPARTLSGRALDVGCAEGCGAIVDSGTSLLSLPSSHIERIRRALLGNRSSFDCSRLGELPDLAFAIGGREYRLPPDAYVGEIVGEPLEMAPSRLASRGPERRLRHTPPKERCGLLLTGLNERTELGPTWILGMPFFREYYTTFSYSGTSPPYQQDLYVAPAGDGCLPQGSRMAHLQVAAAPLQAEGRPRRIVPRRVDVSTLQLPRWAAKMGLVGGAEPV